MKDPLASSVVCKVGVEDNKSSQESISNYLCDITIVRECRLGTSETMF